MIFDPVTQVLMLSHLGRHSIEQNGGRESIDYLVREFDSKPSDLLVWLSPAVGKNSYPLVTFGGRGLHEITVNQMVEAGVELGNIEVSHVNTAENPDYFSHSEYLKGEQVSDGRFAVVAMMVE